MAPPVSFITISSIPFSQLVTQAMFNVASVQWFKYTAVVPIVIGTQVNQGGTFIPRVEIYNSAANIILHGANGSDGSWHTLRTAGDYYIKVSRQPSGPTNFDFTFKADTRPLDIITVVPGDIIINDDVGNLPAAVLSVTGEVKFFVSDIPASEMGAILPSNVSFWHDYYGQYSTTNRIAVIDANLNYVTSVACGLVGTSVPVFAVDVVHDKVYVINKDGELWTISNTGVAANTGYIFPLVADMPQVAAVDETGNILYWSNVYQRIGKIHALNLNTFTVLPDFYTFADFIVGTDYGAITPNNHQGDMFVMPDGKVVTWWTSWATPIIYHLVVISKLGVLLHQYDYGSETTSLDHIAYINGDSDHIYIWLYSNDFNEGLIGRLTLATGVIDYDFITPLFGNGQSMAEAPLGYEMFGPSSSCTMLIYQSISEPEPEVGEGGIYFINRNKSSHHDSYYGDVELKIPNPMFRTGRIGE